MDIKRGIESFLHGDMYDTDKVLETYSTDASIFKVKPALVIAPKDVSDIQNLVTFINKHPEQKLSITPRAAGTDMSGGPLTESIVLDMKKYFTHVFKVGPDYAITEPGVMYRDFEKQTLKRGLLLPCYPASRELCAVGGMVANNCAGEKSLTYGKADQYVAELKVVLSDGNTYTIKPLNLTELKKKLGLKNFEGDFYRKIFKLCEDNYDLLQTARPKVSKDSTGYPLWKVWDKKTFDLTQLFVGSQGTLGIITEIKFKLIKPKPKSKLVVVFLTDLAPLAKIVNSVLEYKPESFECYDDQTLKLALRFLPEIAQRIKGQNIVTLLLRFIPEAMMILRHGMPKLFLLAEFTGDNESEVLRRATAAQAELESLNLTSFIAPDSISTRKYWVIRRESFNLLRHHVHGKHTAPFIDDVTVTPAQLPEFLPALNKIMGEYNLTYTIAGHIGDANFHIFPLMDLKDPEIRKIIPELSKRVFDLVFKFKGSMSGEHNDGLVRTPYLKDMYGKEVVAIFQEVKNTFDPNAIFNPGKKVDVPLAYANKHILTQ